MKAQKLLLLACFALICTACDNSATTDTNAAATNSTTNTNNASANGDQKLIATINSRNVYMSDFERFASQRIAENPQLQQAPQVLLNELINRELLIQTAETEGVDKKEDIQARIKTERDSIVLAALLDDKLGGTDLSDDCVFVEAEFKLQGNRGMAFAGNASHLF